MSTVEPDERRRRTTEAVAAFAVLMHAYERGEMAKAASAQEELAQLGVVVRFGRPQSRQRKGDRS